eukprot:31534-Pelagococcus_subviridis.AAC.14
MGCPSAMTMCTRDGDATLASDSSDFLGIRRSTSSSDAPKRFSSVFLSFFTSAPPSWRREAEGRTTGSRSVSFRGAGRGIIASSR